MVKEIPQRHQDEAEIILRLGCRAGLVPILRRDLQASVRVQELVFGKPRAVDVVERTGLHKNRIPGGEEGVHDFKIRLELAKVSMPEDLTEGLVPNG